jgi:hypothetical protein
VPRAFTPQLLRRGFLRQDEAIALRVSLEYAHLQVRSDERPHCLRYPGLVRVDGADRDELRERHESSHADIHDDAAPVRFDDRHVDHVPVLLHLLELHPLLPIPDAAEREDDPAVRPLRLRDDSDDVFTYVQRVRPDLMKGDHARGTITEIHGRLVSGHGSNGSFDGLAHSEWS